VVCEVKGVEEGSVRLASTGARSTARDPLRAISFIQISFIQSRA